MALLDIGHLSQTYQLVATALGLSTWITGAFKDSAVRKLLNIKRNSEQPIFFISAGISTGSAVPTEFLEHGSPRKF